MQGRAISLSPSRRMVSDLLHFARQIPTVPVQRVMNLQDLVEARAALEHRPSWVAIFAKAYARLAQEVPELRRVYVKFPWPHLYEYPLSVASVAVERVVDGEPAVLISRISDPSLKTLFELDETIRSLSELPVDQIKDFRRALRISRLPRFVRRPLWWLGLNLARQRPNYFGTFLVTVYSGLGAESLHPLAPFTTTLNYGVIAPDGTVPVRIVYDHRVMDGAVVARALARLEVVLREEIVAELDSSPSAPANLPAPVDAATASATGM